VRAPSLPSSISARRTARSSTASASPAHGSTRGTRSPSGAPMRCSGPVSGDAYVSELTYTIIRLGLLAFLWVFVLSLAAVLRRDIYGTRISRRSRRDRRASPPSPARTPVPAGAAAGAAAAAPSPQRPPRRRREPATLVVTDGQMAGTSLP